MILRMRWTSELSIILEIDHMQYLHVAKWSNLNETITVENKESIYTLLPKIMGSHSFFFPKLTVLSAFILVLYRILSLQQLQG